MSLFNVTGKQGVTKGKLHQIIMEFGDTPNADIQYHEGYTDEVGNFVSLGVNKAHLQDVKEIKDEEGKITQKASTGFSDFIPILLNLKTPQEIEDKTTAFLKERIEKP